MKIAHLILAHNYPEQLSRMIEALNHPQFDFYIHIDKKKDVTAFSFLFEKQNVFFIEERVNVLWGGWGTIQATLNGFQTIQNRGYDYINVISGQDFPIKPVKQIYNFFLANRDVEFITCDTVGDNWKNVGSRITRYHLVNWPIPGKFSIEKILNMLLPPRKFPLDFRIVGRANWFTLTDKAVRYILTFLRDNPAVVRYFKYCWGADEFIFSTILYNSRFKEQIRENLMYVQWSDESKGHPDILDTKDLENLQHSDKLFARKFDARLYPDVLEILEKINNGS